MNDLINKKHNLFKKILIANRGEIALRILRACKELGVSTVALYTSLDSNCLAVKFADEAYHVADYLDGKEIINIAKKSGCDAIHPGYGFLSENFEFACLCDENEIRFIGPNSGVLKLVSDKVETKILMEQLGFPIIISSNGHIKDY